jgi:hypothetical protein
VCPPGPASTVAVFAAERVCSDRVVLEQDVAVNLAGAARRVAKAIMWAPENSTIGWRRRFVPDLVWYGAALVVSSIGGFSFWSGWLRLIMIVPLGLGVGMLVNAYRRAIKGPVGTRYAQPTHSKSRRR